jgi:hypothetical protein
MLTVLWSTFGALASPVWPEVAIATMPTVDGPVAVLAADLDGDGDQDAVVASCDDDSISWFENMGGAFGPKRTITDDARCARGIDAADLDGDGDVDVLSASSGDGIIGWYENLGGHFAGQRVVGVHAHLSGIEAIDKDGDGDMDILVANGLGSPVIWFKNVGDAFVRGRSRPDEFVSSVHGDDMDGDGDVDLVSASFDDDTVSFHENVGETFPAPIRIDLSLPGATVFPSADVDDDGLLDVLATSTLDAELVWYRQTAVGFEVARLVGRHADPLLSVQADDMDGDGDPDLLVATKAQVMVYENTGGGFAAPTSVEDSDAFPGFVAHASDFDGDGDSDLLVAAAGSDSVAWYENLGAMSFGPQRLIVDDGTEFRFVHSIDVDSDGLADLLYAKEFPFSVVWRRNLGGHFGKEWLVSTDESPAAHLNSGDFDGDGHVDALIVWNDRLVWARNEAGTGFGAEMPITLLYGGAPHDTSVVDFDGDGDLDLIAAHTNNDYIRWHKNLGTGAFAEPTLLVEDWWYGGIGRVLREVETPDLDGDGDPDVVVGLEDRLQAFENLGAGVLGPPTLVAMDNYDFLRTADLDGDGDQDIVGFDYGHLHVFDNLGGTFGGVREVASLSNPRNLQVADIDSDGDPDLVTLNYGPASSAINWFTNDGMGSFAGYTGATGLEYTQDAALVDIDGDGAPDVLVSSDSLLAFYRNPFDVRLFVAPMHIGVPAELRIDGQWGSGDTIVAMGRNPGRTCLGALDGLCLELNLPTKLGEAPGGSFLTPAIPDRPGTTVGLQVAELDHGVSNAVTAAAGDVQVLGDGSHSDTVPEGWRGLHLEALEDTVLLEYGLYLNVGDCLSLQFEVYSDSGAGWHAMAAEPIPPVRGHGYHRAPIRDLPLNTGTRYMVGVGWDRGCDVSFYRGPMASGLHLGPVQHLGLAGSNDGAPPTPTIDDLSHHGALLFP